jgi:hypothetical protein
MGLNLPQKESFDKRGFIGGDQRAPNKSAEPIYGVHDVMD